MFLKTVLFVLALLFVVSNYFGAFQTINVRTEFQGGEIIAYEALTGNYKQTAEVTDRIYHSLLDKDNIRTYKGIGIYYDDPSKVPENQLRFEAGCVLDNIPTVKIHGLETKYKIKTLPKGKYVVAEFPFKGMPSVLFGIKKVYPAMKKYMEAEKITSSEPSVEIYDVPGKKIIYRIKLP